MFCKSYDVDVCIWLFGNCKQLLNKEAGLIGRPF